MVIMDSNEHISNIRNPKFINVHRGMVSMVSMEVSKTLGAGSSPATPATIS